MGRLAWAFSVHLCDKYPVHMDSYWAISWDYGTFHPPSTHSSITHAQPSSGARCLIFGRTLHLLPYFMCANSEGSGKTAQRRWLAWAFAGCLCDKYHNLMSWLISIVDHNRHGLSIRKLVKALYISSNLLRQAWHDKHVYNEKDKKKKTSVCKFIHVRI